MTADTITLTLALRELVDLVEASLRGEYEIDSFTCQPARAALEGGGEDKTPEPNRSYTIPVELQNLGRGKPIEDRSHELEIDDGMDDDEPDRIDIAAERSTLGFAREQGRDGKISTESLERRYLRALDELEATRRVAGDRSVRLLDASSDVDAAIARAEQTEAKAQERERERDEARALVHRVWAAAIHLQCDAAIVADKQYTSEFVLANIVGSMEAWKEQLTTVESERDAARKALEDMAVDTQHLLEAVAQTWDAADDFDSAIFVRAIAEMIREKRWPRHIDSAARARVLARLEGE